MNINKKLEQLLDLYLMEELLDELGYAPIEIMQDLLAQGYFTEDDLQDIYCELAPEELR